MNSLVSRLSLLAVLAAATAALPACQGAPDSPEDDVDEAQGAFLYGLDEADILSLYPLASSPVTVAEWVDLHRGPFDCANYGDMCKLVGPDAAYAITEQSYLLGLDGATREEVDAFLAKELDAAAEAWKAAQEAEHADERDSADAFDTGTANDERVKTTVFAVKPLAGTWNVHVECTYQVKTLGVWGGSSSAYLQATLSGHMHRTSGAIYDQSANWVTADIYDHSITTAKLYFYPDTSTDDLHGFGTCDAHKGAWSASASTNVVNN